MKRFFSAALLAAFSVAASAATAPSYINYGTVTSPVTVDATNFVNLGVFSPITTVPFDFSNVRNFTNRGTMANLGSGFRFDTAPSSAGVRRPAASFFNAPIAGNPAMNADISGATHIMVWATNIVHRGVLNVSGGGLIRLDGRDVDASRGVIQVGAFGDRQSLLPEAVFDTAWGFGEVEFAPGGLSPDAPQTGGYDYTLFMPPTPYVSISPGPGLFLFDMPPGSLTNQMFIRESGTNRSVQIVFLRNSNPNISTRVFSRPNPSPQLAAYGLGIPIIEWSAVGTNAFGQRITNFLYLTDTFGVNQTNIFTTNYPFASPPPQSVPIPPETLQPANFSISRFMFLPAVMPVNWTGTNVPAAWPPGFWSTNEQPGEVTAQYSAYNVRIAATSTDPMQVTNLRAGPGRIEINATGVLNLNHTRIEGLNYLSIIATNHFAGAPNASLLAAYADVRLGSTNGQLNTTGLLRPDLPRFNGVISCFSVTWTNELSILTNVTVDVDGVPTLVETNVPINAAFHVLFVDSSLANFIQPQVLDLNIRSTNASVGDTFNVFNSLHLDVENLTILSNGVISARNPAMVWADSAARVRNFTNFGLVNFWDTYAEISYVGRNANGSERPYGWFVNEITGASIAAAHRIVAANVVNSGVIESRVGPIHIHAVSNVSLLGGFLSAPNADITIHCHNLVISNSLPVSPLGRTLTLAVTNNLLVGPSYWEVFDGFNLLRRPVTGDLRETAVVSHAFPYAEVISTWAGEDRGPAPAGFTNNAALGRLTLDGGPHSLFTFTGAGPSSNALYVDVLILQNDAALRDAGGNLLALACNPGMRIYFGQVFANGVDITAEMNGRNGGALVHVPGVAGPMTVVPRLRPENLNLAVAVLPAPQPRVEVSWNSVYGAVNRLYAMEIPGGGRWTEVTNFVSRTNGRVFYQQPPGASGRFFRVTVTPP